jgi:hypothetical protein
MSKREIPIQAIRFAAMQIRQELPGLSPQDRRNVRDALDQIDQAVEELGAMEPTAGIEPATSPIPRECSTK